MYNLPVKNYEISNRQQIHSPVQGNFDIELNDFVVVRLTPVSCNKENIFYLGTVVETIENGYLIKCMRRLSKASFTQFIFPYVDDISMYMADEVFQRLSLPKVVRGVHNFLEDELLHISKYLR